MMKPDQASSLPKEKDTLAIKQRARIRRLGNLKNRLPQFSSLAWGGVGEGIGLVVLFMVNFYLLRPFFGHEDTVNVFSAPVVPLLASAIEKLIPFPYALRIWLLVFLLFFPISFYYLVRGISGKKLAGFLSTAIAILPLWVFLPSRVSMGLFAGDGAQVASLTFTPFVCLFLLWFLKSGKFWVGIAAAFGNMLVALTSPVGFLILGIFEVVVTFSEMLLGSGRLKAFRFLAVVFLSAGFSSFWYSPQFALLILRSIQGQVIIKTFANLLPLSFFVFPILGVFGYLLFENRPQLQSQFIALFLTVSFGLFSLGAGVAHSVPHRFLPAFGISLAFWLGITLDWLFEHLADSPKLARFKLIYAHRRSILAGSGLMIVAFLVLSFVFFRQGLWQIGETKVLGLTSGQKIGLWSVREQLEQSGNLIGYLITSLTGAGVIVIKSKLKI